MLILSGRFYLVMILVVVFGSLTGCSSVTGAGDPGNEGLSNSDEEEASGSDTDSENPSDAQPGEPPEPSDEALPDFSVADVNADSARYGEAVSPRDYLGQISAWYFGHST
ncbi:MAG: hypothetical protein JSU86_18455 [Phycisphaerales bacterium]|nr:MAG: hypothetical protein JSU86_18455 [Phycisphaerales bacterium]